MKVTSFITALAIACVVPTVAHAQEKKIICADNTIVTTDAACDTHGGKQKPGGLHRVGKEINKAAIDTKDEAQRTPKNVGKAAAKVGHGTKEAAEDASEDTKKTVAPKKYHAACKDGSTWSGRTKKGACRKHGGVANWS